MSALSNLNANEEPRVKFGLHEVDDATNGGIAGGEVVVLAGRPGMGKSALALQVALMNPEQHPAIISLEMTAEQLAERVILRTCSIPQKHWRRNPGQVVADCAGSLLGTDSIHLFDAPDRRLQTILEAMEFAISDYGSRLILLDYLQLVSFKSSDKYAEITTISQELKQFARRHRVALIVLAQLSRAVEQRGDGVPRLSDLRDSGAIEQDADNVILIWTPYSYSGEDDDKNLLNLVMPKCRSGRKIESPVSYVFDQSRQTIAERAAEHYENYAPSLDAWNER